MGQINTQSKFCKQKIIGFKANFKKTELLGIAENHSIKIKKQLPLVNAYLCEVDTSLPSYQSLAKNPAIDFIEDDYILNIQVMPSEPLYIGRRAQEIPWGVKRINAPPVWKHISGDGIRVGIIDTGIDLSHPDLKENIKDVYGPLDCKNIEDDNGHGTHVAGTIAALDNDIGVIGVSPKVSIYSAKAFDGRGRGRVSNIIESLNWCIKKKVHVINMSFGFTMRSFALERAIKEVYRHNIVMIAAAGNSGGDNKVMYPAKYSEVIATAASDINDGVASFSSGGLEVDVLAPGVDIISTYIGGKYKKLSGTSMASPHVTGACALLLSRHNLSPEQVKSVLSYTAKDLGHPREKQGAGLINASKAVLS